MTKELFKAEYYYIEKCIQNAKNTEQAQYELGRQSMLVSWALDVLPTEDVKEVLYHEN